MTQSPQSTEAANEWVVRRLVGELNEGNLDVLDEVFDSGYRTRMVRAGSGDTVGDREGLRSLTEEYLTAFPDYHERVVEILADDDRVATYTEVTGTHEGPFRGVEPTGESVRFHRFGLYWLRDGRVVRSTGIVGWPTLLSQLGVDLPIEG
jgi:predicted ester cyclase